MPDHSLYLFGTPRIVNTNETVSLSHHKAVALLAYLAVTRRPLSRDGLASLFWPDEEPSKGRAELRRMLWVINKGAGQGWLETSRQTVGISSTADLFIDTYHFKWLLNGWERHGHGRDTLSSEYVADLAQAVELYKDQFMAGFTLFDSDGFERWQQQQAIELHQDAERALDKLIAWHRLTDSDGLIEYSQRRLQLNPTHEPTHRLLMAHYAGQHQPAAALNQYQQCVAALKAELDLEPSEETTAMHEQIRSGRFAPQPLQSSYKLAPTTATTAAHTAPTTRIHNLPAQITPFVGRTDEITQLTNLLSDDNIRFVSIVAPGGMGKTRLALETGKQLLPNFVDGVFLVELAPLEDGNNIIPALAEAVGYAFQQTGRSQKQQVFNFLANKQLLLILDNFEHLLGSASLAQELLQAVPYLKLLVTSRQRLNQFGETMVPLAGMGLPDDHLMEANLSYPSIQLFQQTARRAQPTFELSIANLPEVIRIGELVAGMPLGILLAASWVSLLSLREIVAEIEQGLDILASDNGAFIERQRSIRVVLDSTFQMLNAAEQEAFMKMSLFRGGFDREAVQQIAGANLRQLQSLINKSLIHRDNETGRYRVHELLRQYAEEQLATSPMRFEATETYTSYFLTYLAAQTPTLKGREQQEARHRIEADFENIRASWLLAIKDGALDLVDKAIEAMYLFCLLTSRLEDGKALFDISLLDNQPLAKNHVVWHRFNIRFYSGDSPSLVGEIEQAMGNSTDQAEIAFGNYTLGTIAHYVAQDPLQAIDAYQKATAAYRTINEPYYLANTLSKLGEAYQMIGQANQTLAHVNEAYALQQQIGDRLGESETLRALSMCVFIQCQYVESLVYLEKALQIQEETEYLVGQASSLLYSGLMYFMRGETDTGRQRMQAGLDIATDVVDYSTQAWCHVLLATLEGSVGNQNEAADHIAKARAIETDPFRQTGGGNPFLNLSLTFSEMIMQANLGEYEAIQQTLPEALGFSYQAQSKAYIAYFLPILALELQRTQQYETAVELLGLIDSLQPAGIAWLDTWQTYMDMRAVLKAHLGDKSFEAVWRRGQKRELLSTTKEMLEQLAKG